MQHHFVLKQHMHITRVLHICLKPQMPPAGVQATAIRCDNATTPYRGCTASPIPLSYRNLAQEHIRKSTRQRRLVQVPFIAVDLLGAITNVPIQQIHQLPPSNIARTE
jgi:hypothetical protein